MVNLVSFLPLLSVILLFPTAETKPPTATLSFNLTSHHDCTQSPDGTFFLEVWVNDRTVNRSCSKTSVTDIIKNGFVHKSISICQHGDVIFHWKLVTRVSSYRLGSCTVFIWNVTLQTSSNSTEPVELCPNATGQPFSPIIRIGNESTSVLSSTCSCRRFRTTIFPSIIPHDQFQCFDDQGSCPEGYSHRTAPSLSQCLPGENSLIGTCYKGLFNETRSCSQCGQFDEPVCNYDAQFSGIISMINRSPNGALQNLSQNLTQFTPEQSIVLFDTIISRGINTSVANATEMVLRTAELIVNELPRDELVEVKLSVATQFLVSLDVFALNLTESTSFDFGNIFLNVTRIESFSGERLTVLNYEGNSLSLPAMIFNSSLPATVASFVYSNLASIFSPTDGTELISPVVSAAVDCNGTCITNELIEPVTISFSHTQQTLSAMSGSSISCVFWNIALSNDSLPSGFWDSEGCNVTSVDGQSVTCQCNHLTHFAILLSPGGLPEADSIHSKILTIAGQILVPISLVCLLMVILTYSCLRSLWSMRNYIHIMLCSNLFISQLMFLIGIEQTANPSLCSAIAVLLQYMFLVTFMWMLMEGVVLYVSLVKVFVKHPKRYIIGFTIISYGVPALYMLFIVPIGFLVNTPDHSHYLYYTDDTLYACWLSYESGFIWSFIGPVILIIIVNIGFFVMSIVIIRRHQKKQGKGNKPQHWIKATLSLTVVMGIGWIGSVLFFSQQLLFIAYIMTIFIAGQGILIFILYVPLSSNVREAYAKFLKKRLANWSLQSSFLTRSTASRDSKKKSTEDNHYTLGCKEVNTIVNGLDAEKNKSTA